MYTGVSGALKRENSLGVAETIAYISGWSIEDKTEMVESSEFSALHKETVPGFRSWSASADGAVSFAGENGHLALLEAKSSGKKINFMFCLEDGNVSPTGKTDLCFRGSGYIETLSVDLSAADKGNISISVAGSGPLELYDGDKNLVADREKEKITFKVGEGDGHLYAEVPDYLSDKVRIDDTGHLIIEL